MCRDYLILMRNTKFVNNFSGTFSQQVRIVGATEKPASIPYRANMTLLDAMIAVGGLSEFAAGNRARLVRFDKETGKVLFKAKLPFSGNATPSTYMVNGRQYVVISAGSGKSGRPRGGSLVAFALPE